MLIRKTSDIAPHEITDETVFRNRRRLLAALGVAGLGLLGHRVGVAQAWQPTAPDAQADDVPGHRAVEAKLDAVVRGAFQADQPPTPHYHVTHYNNFYEFGTGKGDPVRHAGKLQVDPWRVKVSGEASKTGVFDLEDILAPHPLEERIYRFRCVEAWSMVVPWIGFPLADLLKRFEPTSRAKFVRFETLADSAQMPGIRRRVIDFPYVEGLRIDEAMHPLTFAAVGLYGDALPNQNGAPLRLVVPWKYGFKSIKSIVAIKFMERRPKTTWELANSREYGFYSNVNPEVDHPRWSQKNERVLPVSLFSSKTQPTLKFNGYGEQVASLYAGMDLRRYF